MLQIDKSYYDYDYEKVEAPQAIVNWEDTILSDEEVHDVLSMFGLGGNMEKNDEYMQNYILKEEQKHGSRDSGSY